MEQECSEQPFVAGISVYGLHKGNAVFGFL